MKYTILGFQQNKLIENNISVAEALVLRVVKDMYSSDRMNNIIKEDKRYIWLNHKYLLSQIPIIGSHSTLKRMLKKLCDDEILESVLITNKKNTAGRYYYVKYTQKLNDMEDYDFIVTKGQNELRPKVKMNFDQRSKWTNKDSSIIDSSIIDSKPLEQFEKLWNLYPHKKGKATAQKKVIKLLKDKKVTYEEMEKCIDRYKDYVEFQRKNNQPGLQYQHGSTFFNGTYIDYLDENYKEMKIQYPKSLNTSKLESDHDYDMDLLERRLLYKNKLDF